MALLDILKQYATPGTSPNGDVYGHFDTVAQQSTSQDFGKGIAAAMRSDATPSFGATIGNLFGQSNPTQKAGVLNEILQALGPAEIANAGGGILSQILWSASSALAPTISPAQAAQVTPADLSVLASHAEQQNGSIVDRLGNFYAQHPTLVKTLGVAALGAVMSHMSNQQRV